MKVVSIDVGIKNLAVCVFDICLSETSPTYSISAWDVLNLTRMDDYKCAGNGDSTSTSASLCNNEVKYTKNGLYFCLKHAKKQPWEIPTNDIQSSFLKKQKLANLHQIAEKHCVAFEIPIKKCILIEKLESHREERCFDVVSKVDASKLDLVTVGKNIHKKMDIFLEPYLSDIDLVLIENQISPIANRMKTIQGMITQYFIMKIEDVNIRYVSSMNKLQDLEGEVENYAQRKKAGIQKCLGILCELHPSWVDYFKANKKKDDLADCFLQGIWYLKHQLSK